MADPPTPPEPPPPAGSSPPPVIRPINLIAAVIIAVCLLYNLHLDAQSKDYNGAYITYGLVLGLCLVLGVDLSKFWRGRGE